MRPKVIFKDVSKSYKLYKKQSDKVVELLTSKKVNEDFHAVKNVSFTIYDGDVVGIVGLNGAGKSTLSNLIAQIIPPTSGDIIIKGETSLISISVGLNNQLSGLENIRLKCLMHGISNSRINELLPKIIEFADIGKFIDQPVKSYSSGMKSKLGFAISVHTDPDILIIDEALSVGDQTFYQKCIDKMNEFKEQGKTIIFISHSASQVKSFCNKVIWMNYGQIEMYDESDVVIEKYNEFAKWFNSLTKSEKNQYRKEKLDAQYFSDQKSYTKRSRSNKITKRESLSFIVQLLILFILLLITIAFMFKLPTLILNETPFQQEIDSATVEVVANLNPIEVESIEIVNKKAIVIVDEAKVYNSSGESSVIDLLNFATELYLTEKIEDRYKFEANDNEYYIDEDQVVLIDDNKVLSDYVLDSFLPIFPDNFASSYMYFFSFLGASSDQINAGINGNPIQSSNNFGITKVEFPSFSVEYHLNDENISNGIVISEINTENLEEMTINNFELNDSIYFILTEEYIVIINEELEKVLFLIN